MIEQRCNDQVFFFSSGQDLVPLLDQWECRSTRTGAEMPAGISVDAE